MKLKHVFVIFLLVCLNVVNSGIARADIVGKVVGVLDGDTVTVLDGTNTQFRVRLAQIDAPEKNMAFGAKSKESLSNMVYMKQVLVKVASTDRYQRNVGTIFVDSTDINLEQVKRGMAWVYRQYSHDPMYVEAENRARERKVGLWSDANPVAPWDFRHGKLTTQHEESLGPKSQNWQGQCGAKQRCKEMVSCDEARFYLNTCHVASLDRNGDGVPCESLCR